MNDAPAQKRSLGRSLITPVSLLVIAVGSAIVGAVLTGATTGAVTSGVESLSASSGNFLGDVSNLIPLGFAFGAGMVAAVNPCGFAMLPAYLGLYVGTDDASSDSSVGERLGQASLVGVVMTAGFILLFGVVGIAIAAGAQPLVKFFPWIGLGIGVLLALAGAWMIGSGSSLYSGFAERLSARMGDAGQRNLKGYFAFGLGYGTASLSCTLPIFLTVVGSTLTAGNFLDSAFQFVLYGLGMGVVIMVLTLSIAIFRNAMINKVRKVLPYVQPVSAGLLLVAGGYIVYYWLTLGELLNSFI
ncbi:MAG: cytochrome c biogenesis protein CcdA [Chloroflexi bacterium]|nr:cytochrome c biogenesis protein CcdA [Chloroflexota bacterium]